MMEQSAFSLLGKALNLYVRSWKTQFVIYGTVFFVALAIAVISDFGMGMPLDQVIALIAVVVVGLLFVVPIGYTIAVVVSRSSKGFSPTSITVSALPEAEDLSRSWMVEKSPSILTGSEATKGVDNQMQTSNNTTNAQVIDVLEEKDRRFRETWQPRLTLIFSIVAIIVSAFALIIRGDYGFSNLFNSIYAYSRYIIIGANLVVSLIFFIALAKQKTVEFIIHDKERFKSLAELNTAADIQIYTTNLNNRVSKLVNQFRLHMTLFAFSLILIYGVILLAALRSSDEIDITVAIPSQELARVTEKQAVSGGGNGVAETTPNPVTSAPEQPATEPSQNITLQKSFRKIGYYPIAINLINLLGALFVQLGFSVLYNKTLEAHKDRTGSHRDPTRADKDQYSLETTQILTYNSSLYWGVPLLFFVLYALIFISLSTSYLGNRDIVAVTLFLNIFDLLAGLANGLTMSLLFGRYVSIEQSIGSTSRFKTVFENILYPFSSIPYKVFVSLGIVFILPIYALAQPLFGSLRIDAFGDADNFQTIVYAICLVGKICFLHLTYLLISKRLLHLYLYGLASKVGNFKELENCFDPKAQQEALS